MKRSPMHGTLALAVVALAGCDAGKPSDPAAAVAAGPVALAAPGTARPPVAAPAAAGDRFAARTREVVNPDSSTMVFLYFDLARLKPPIDEWVEKDARVQFAAPPDKAARRSAVRAELEAGLAAVRDVGRIRLSVANSELSDYDPAHGEFTVRALSPASELSFQALGQKVVTRFANGETAQLWRVPSEQAQAVRDRVAGRAVALDVVLQVTGVQPGPGGGAIIANVVEYALRAGDGGTLARVQ